jgi:hypothetical protein
VPLVKELCGEYVEIAILKLTYLGRYTFWLLQSKTADSFLTRYMSLFTFSFRFLRTSVGDPQQFLVTHVVNVAVLPGVVRLRACCQNDSFDRRQVKLEKGFNGLIASCYRSVGHQFSDALKLRDTFLSSVLSDGHDGIGFSDQLMVEVRSFLGTASGVSRDALPELSVLRWLSITDFVVIWHFVVAHNLLTL